MQQEKKWYAARALIAKPHMEVTACPGLVVMVMDGTLHAFD